MKREYAEIDGWLICTDCHHPRHSLWRYVRGWLVWHLICRPWPITARNMGMPPLLKYAGDCIFDCRSCRHG